MKLLSTVRTRYLATWAGMIGYFGICANGDIHYIFPIFPLNARDIFLAWPRIFLATLVASLPLGSFLL